jgi:hypothetical protein
VVARVRAARRELPVNVRVLGWVSLANDMASELAYPIVPLFLTITLGRTGIGRRPRRTRRSPRSWWSA